MVVKPGYRFKRVWECSRGNEREAKETIYARKRRLKPAQARMKIVKGRPTNVG